MLIYARLVATMIFWGGTFVAGRHLMQSVGPFTAAFLRFFLASLFLLFLTRVREGRFPPLRRRQVLPALLLGLSGVFGYNYFFFSGLSVTAASRGALIIATNPVFVALFSALLLGERLSLLRLAGILLSISGAALIITGGDLSSLAAQGVGMGEASFLGAVACWVAYTIGGKRVMADMTPYAAVTWSCILGAIMLAPFAVAKGLPHDLGSLEPAQWGDILYLAFLGTGLGFSWFYQGVQAIGAARAAVFINLVPVSAVILGFLLLDEPVGMVLLAGGALVLTGVYLTNRRQAAPGASGQASAVMAVNRSSATDRNSGPEQP